jgi:hypothetical protein
VYYMECHAIMARDLHFRISSIVGVGSAPNGRPDRFGFSPGHISLNIWLPQHKFASAQSMMEINVVL